jgi:sugar phosphate isomerase/epimerase
VNVIEIALCTIAFRNEPLVDIIPRIARIGFDSIEIIRDHIEGKSDEELLAIREAAAAAGLGILSVDPYLWLTQDDKLREESMEIARRYVHYAQVLGAKKFRTFTDSGPTGIGSDVATEEHWRQAVSCLKEITAMDRDLAFAVEMHPQTLADTPESALRLMTEVGSANMELLYQPTSKMFISDYHKLKRHIRHMHLQNQSVDGGHALIDEGVMDFPAFFREIVEDGYDYSVALEYCWKGIEWEQVESAFRFLKRHLRS